MRGVNTGGKCTQNMEEMTMPDVSHLSEAERAVLQEVWRRQKEEEEKLRDANRYAHTIVHMLILDQTDTQTTLQL